MLVLVWLWALRNADKYGNLFEIDGDDIAEAVAGCTSISPEQLFNAMVDTKWFDISGKDVYLHDWETWQEQWYKAQEAREKDNERKRDARKKKQYQDYSEEFSQEPLQDVDTEPPRTSPPEKSYTTDFERVWDVYPRKIGKSSAYAKYCARLKDGWTKEQLLEATLGYAAQVRRLGTEKEYIKHAQTFFGPNTPFTDFLKNKGSLREEVPSKPLDNPFSEYEDAYGTD